MSGASPLLNIPNLLSFLRLPLAVVFIMTESPQGRAAIIVLAAITDGLDGWAARRLGQQSSAGQLVDPITDKLFVLVALATMTARGELAAWMVLLLLARDIYTSFAFFIVLGMGWNVHFKARFIGKTVTVLQFSTLIAALLRPGSGSLGSRLLRADDPATMDGVGDVYHVSGLHWRECHGKAQTPSALAPKQIFSPCAAASSTRARRASSASSRSTSRCRRCC